jgi:hypothetical protein
MAENIDRPFRDVLHDIVGNVQEIVRSEIHLATAEIRQEGKKAALGARVFGAGALLCAYAGGVLVLALVYALSLVVAPWLAAAAVAVATGILGGTLILLGKKQLQQVDMPPPRTTDTLKENIEWAARR